MSSGAHSFQEVGVGLAITVPLAVAYSYLWMYIGKKTRMTDDVYGSPRYLTYACMLGASFGLVPIAFAGWLVSGLDLEEYMHRPWLEGEQRDEQRLEVLWLYAFVFQMMKDLPVGVSPLIALHHAVCITTALVFLFISPPGLLTVGGGVLEIGSATNCVALLNPASKPVAHLNLAVMSLSNLFGVWCAWITFTSTVIPAAAYWLLPPTALILSAMRQIETIKSHRETVGTGKWLSVTGCCGVRETKVVVARETKVWPT